MDFYVGTKQLEATPMTLGDYNIHRNWDIPIDEDPNKEGYLVQYPDEYVSWSPKKQFEEAYKHSGTFNFGHAIFLLKRGHKVCRAGWNGKNMFLFLVSGSVFEVNREPLLSILGEGTKVNYNSHIDIKMADGSIGTWSPSNADTLAEDWCIVLDPDA